MGYKPYPDCRPENWKITTADGLTSIFKYDKIDYLIAYRKDEECMSALDRIAKKQYSKDCDEWGGIQLTKQEKQEIIQSIDLNSIAESVRMACIGCLNAMEEIIPIIKKNLEDGEINEYIKQELARQIVNEMETEK